jgi:choline kinase
MKVLLLAAGRGTRISRYLSGNPKCTVDIGEEQLIRYTINMFQRKGITEIAMVLGYRAEVIKELLKDYNIKYYYNPFFDVTNSIASAWFAREYLADMDDTLIMNADVYLEESLLDHILACKLSPVMFADGTRIEDADYKFQYADGQLLKYGKELTPAETSGEYIGAGRFAKEFMPQFLQKLDAMIANQEHSVWWENILYSMVGSQPVYVDTVDGMFWAEVDYVEDYERILKHRGYQASFSLKARPIADAADE